MHNPFTEVIDESADLELIELSKSGSQTAIEKLILRHQAWIYNIAIRMVFHPHDAEEVTQEVLLKAITRLSTFNGESKFRTWLYRITANHVLNMKRRTVSLRLDRMRIMVMRSMRYQILTFQIPRQCQSTCRFWSKKPRSPAQPECYYASIANSGSFSFWPRCLASATLSAASSSIFTRQLPTIAFSSTPRLVPIHAQPVWFDQYQ